MPNVKILLRSNRILAKIKTYTRNKLSFNLKKTVKTTQGLNFFNNDAGFYFLKYKFLFYVNEYKILNNSSLSKSMHFYNFSEKFFKIFNNLNFLFANTDFKINFFCKKINFKLIKNVYFNKKNSKQTCIKFFSENNQKTSLLKNINYYYKSNQLLLKFKKFFSFKKIFTWSLLNRFILKNISYFNFSKFKDSGSDSLSNLFINIKNFEGVNYKFRQYNLFLPNNLKKKYPSNFRYKIKSYYKFSRYSKQNLTSIKGKNKKILFFFYSNLTNFTKFNFFYKTNCYLYRSSSRFRSVTNKNLSPRHNSYFRLRGLPFVFSNPNAFVNLKQIKKYFYISSNSSVCKNTLVMKKYSIFILEQFKLDSTKQSTLDFTKQSTSFIFSKSVSSFIMQHIGLFLHFKLFLFKSKYTKLKYKLKKKVFSFYKKNEIRKFLFINRKKIYMYSYINSKRWKLQRKIKFSNRNFNSNFDFFIKKKIEQGILTAKFFGKSDYLSRFLGFKKSFEEITYPDFFKKTTLLPKNRKSDIRISRLKFKPGYQRLWRGYRANLADAIRYKYIFQKQLTKHLVRLYSQLRVYNLAPFEHKIWKIILYSRLLPDLHTINDFILNRLVYLNGRYLCCSNVNVLVNDIVQLRISIYYYIYIKWVISWNNVRIKKFKKLVYRKKIAHAYKITKSLKQKSFYTPLYIYNMRYDMSDTKPYLEVDFLTLSFVFIYENFLIDFQSSNDLHELKHYTYKMYNWKYVN